MDIKTEKKQSCVLELDVNVPQSELASSEEEAVQHYRSQVSIPGFRKGKAPKNLVIGRYKEDLKKSVLQQVLWSKLSEYIKQENLKTVSDPYIKEISYNLGEDLQFKATLELFPEFDLIDYKNIPVEVEKNEVTQDEKEQALKDLQEKYSQFKSSESGEIRENDFAVIDYEILFEGKSLEKKASTWVKITDEAYIKDFVLQLKGMKIGEKKDITAALPENYTVKEAAGKTAQFDVKVIDVKERVKPELDDDFAKTVGSFESLDKLKENILTNLQEYKKHQSRYSIENQVSDFILKNTEMELPPTLLLQEEQAYIRETLQRMHYNGLKEEDLKKQIPDISKNAKEKARERLIIHFVLETIIEQEKIDISEEDIQQEYENMSRSYRMPVEKIKERYADDEQKAGLSSKLCKIKAIDFITNSVNIKEVEPIKEGQK